MVHVKKQKKTEKKKILLLPVKLTGMAENTMCHMRLLSSSTSGKTQNNIMQDWQKPICD